MRFNRVTFMATPVVNLFLSHGCAGTGAGGNGTEPQTDRLHRLKSVFRSCASDRGGLSVILKEREEKKNE
jgi:hypothetical protein